ncbi:MAG: DUF1638 domain-containing protein [Methanosarcinaceae archaeon]|nr:DUF1638 domain-containing protein [Methanosarcinaceae archaeon]
MIKIGFLGCLVLQDEMLYLIENDPSVKKVTLIKNGEEELISEKLDELGIPYELKFFEQLDSSDNNGSTDSSDLDSNSDSGSDSGSDSDSDIEIIIYLLKLGLHAYPKTLKEVVYEEVGKFSKHVNGILLFYGLCGNVLGKVDLELSTKECPVRILRESNNEVVDDCVGAVLNGRENYLKLLKSFNGVGTFIFFPMNSVTAGTLFESDMKKQRFSEEEIYKMNKFMFKECGYKYVGNLDTGLNYTKDVDSSIKRFADRYDFEVIPLEGGNQDLIDYNYKHIKSAIKESLA